MIILSLAEFNQQSSSIARSLGKTYQNTVINSGPVFSLHNIGAAKQYCKKYTQKQPGSVCIIVKEEHFLRIWSGAEEVGKQAVVKNESTLDSLPIDQEFVDLCQKKLAESIGPIAQMICQKAFAKKPYLTRVEFVDILTKKISNPSQAKAFRKDTLSTD